MNMKKFIIDKSKMLNIDIIGFTDCEPLIDIEEYLLYRIDNGLATEFEERDIKKRVDPKISMGNCKSIIVIGLSYNVENNESIDFVLKGSLSRSSWGIDYHKVLKQRLQSLADEISKVVEFQYQIYVDQGPLVERELAKKAGVGYYGKNCNIINKDYGSFIFLGYMLTDLGVVSDEIVLADSCDDCDLCIRACPTSALGYDYKLNPKRCISYLTQCKGDIPEELAQKMGIKIYGCDTCQIVCPKNKDVIKNSNKEFLPLDTKGAIDIEELMNMTNREFKLKYGAMAGSWRGKKRLQRNATIALENIKWNKNW